MRRKTASLKYRHYLYAPCMTLHTHKMSDCLTYLNQINIIRSSSNHAIVDSLSLISRKFFNKVSNDSFFILMLIALLTFSPFLDVEFSSVVMNDTIAKGSWTYQMFQFKKKLKCIVICVKLQKVVFLFLRDIKSYNPSLNIVINDLVMYERNNS
jgi:hypothetical protein